MKLPKPTSAKRMASLPKGLMPKEDKLPWRRRVIFKDTTLTMYSLGWLALLCGKTRSYFQLLETRGILPKPIFDKQIDGYVRFYTAAEIIGYYRLFSLHPMKRGPGLTNDWAKFKRELHEFHTRAKSAFMGGAPIICHAVPLEEEILKILGTKSKRNLDKEMRNILKIT